jgi:regulation of enolase protein 1 (concanavalin A-like superfamily)
MRRKVIVTIVIALSVALMMAYCAGFASAYVGVADEFSGSSLNGSWTQGGTGTISVGSGYLSITAPGPDSDLWLPNTKAPRVLQSGITQDFTAETKVSGTFNGASGIPQRAGLLVWKDSNNYFRVERKEQSQVHSVICIAGTMTDVVYTNLLSDVNPTYLRVTMQASTLTGEWSQDGATWHNFVTQPGFAYPVQVGLFVIADNDGPFTGNFDYFHISAVGGLSPLPESPLGALAIPLAAVGAVAVYTFAPKLKPKAPKQ